MTANKALHSDKIKLRSFLTTLYFAGELGRTLESSPKRDEKYEYSRNQADSERTLWTVR